MSVSPSTSTLEPYLAAPTKTALLTLGPLTLALGQLLNSIVNDATPLVAIAFAITMIVFAVVATGHHVAEYRLATLENEWH